jgi:hypothetical protein
MLTSEILRIVSWSPGLVRWRADLLGQLDDDSLSTPYIAEAEQAFVVLDSPISGVPLAIS